MYGQRLKSLRESKNLKQTDVADKLGISRNTVSNHERENREPSIDMLHQYAELYDATIDYIVGATEYKDRNWYDELPPALKNFVKKENIDYLKVMLDAQVDEIPPESIEKIIKTIKEVKEDK